MEDPLTPLTWNRRRQMATVPSDPPAARIDGDKLRTDTPSRDEAASDAETAEAAAAAEDARVCDAVAAPVPPALDRPVTSCSCAILIMRGADHNTTSPPASPDAQLMSAPAGSMVVSSAVTYERDEGCANDDCDDVAAPIGSAGG